MTLVAAGLLLRMVPAGVAVAVFPVVLAGYSALLALSPRRVRMLPLPSWATGAILLVSAQIHIEEILSDVLRVGRGWLPVWLVPLALVVIVAASIVMVMAAVLLGQRWHVPAAIVGTVILASITGLPNLYAAVRLALRGDGATVISEAFNSNTLNLIAGLGLPAVIWAPASRRPAPRPRWSGWQHLASRPSLSPSCSGA